MKNFIELKEQEYFHPFPGLKAKVIHTETQTFSFWEIDQGALLPEHHHPHQQVSIVTKGELELTIGGQTQIMRPGMVATIPSNVPHSAKALSPVEVTDVFNPVREDFKYSKD